MTPSLAVRGGLAVGLGGKEAHPSCRQLPKRAEMRRCGRWEEGALRQPRGTLVRLTSAVAQLEPKSTHPFFEPPSPLHAAIPNLLDQLAHPHPVETYRQQRKGTPQPPTDPGQALASFLPPLHPQVPLRAPPSPQFAGATLQSFHPGQDKERASRIPFNPPPFPWHKLLGKIT